MGTGCWLDAYTELAPHPRIGQNCTLLSLKVDEYVYMRQDCVMQNVEIGKFCSIAKEVFIGLGAHPMDGFSMSPLFYRRNNPLGIELINMDVGIEEYQKIIIGNDVWIGTRATIMDGVNIGHGAVIAANAVVTKDVPPYAVVAGVPARIIKYRFGEDKIKKLLSLEWWSWTLDEIMGKTSVSSSNSTSCLNLCDDEGSL